MYLDPDVRKCMSAFALADAGLVDEGVRKLESDLQSGKWNAAHGCLLNEEKVDWGYRFLKAG